MGKDVRAKASPASGPRSGTHLRASRRKDILENGYIMCIGPEAKQSKTSRELETFNVTTVLGGAGGGGALGWVQSLLCFSGSELRP